MEFDIIYDKLFGPVDVRITDPREIELYKAQLRELLIAECKEVCLADLEEAMQSDFSINDILAELEQGTVA